MSVKSFFLTNDYSKKSAYEHSAGIFVIRAKINVDDTSLFFAEAFDNCHKTETFLFAKYYVAVRALLQNS